MQLRDFFQRLMAWHNDSLNLLHLREKFSLDEKSAAALASKFVIRGYIEAEKDGEYKFTDKVGELVRSSAAGKVSRKTAEDALGIAG
jgi:hypothetical protein